MKYNSNNKNNKLLFFCLIICFFTSLLRLTAQNTNQIDTSYKISDSTYIASIINTHYSMYFVSTWLKSPDFSAKVVIPCKELKFFLESDSSFNNDTSKVNDYIFKLLMLKDTLVTARYLCQNDSALLNRYSFSIAEPNDYVNKLNKQGRDSLLLHFFDFYDGIGIVKKNLLKSKNDIERSSIVAAMIDALFQWKIYIHRNECTGKYICSFKGPYHRHKKNKRENDQ